MLYNGTEHPPSRLEMYGPNLTVKNAAVRKIQKEKQSLNVNLMAKHHGILMAICVKHVNVLLEKMDQSASHAKKRHVSNAML